jgi:hypothetical protein
MNIPLYIISKILLYRPHKEDFKIVSKLIGYYEHWLNTTGMHGISFKKYYFTQIIGKEMDINYVYDWLLETYSLDNYYTKKEAYEDLCNDNLIGEFKADHYDYHTCKVDIRISIEKLRKYMIYCKDKLIKNHFEEFLQLQKKLNF